jgi:hypothetical protein
VDTFIHRNNDLRGDNLKFRPNNILDFQYYHSGPFDRSALGSASGSRFQGERPADELDHVEASFAALGLRDIRLWLPKAISERA